MIQRNVSKPSTIIQFGVLVLDDGTIKDFIEDVLIGAGFELVQDGDTVSVLDKNDESHGILSIVLKLAIAGRLNQRKLTYEKPAFAVLPSAQSR